jgi:hypothetical protein
VLKTLLFWHYDLSSWIRSLIFVVCFVALWGCASLRLFSRNAVPRWVLGCLGTIALLFLGSLVYESTIEVRQRAGVIVVEQAVARKGDGENYEPVFKEPLHTGTEFVLIEDRGDWHQVELSDGARCWLPEKAMELVW